MVFKVSIIVLPWVGRVMGGSFNVIFLDLDAVYMDVVSQNSFSIHSKENHQQ